MSEMTETGEAAASARKNYVYVHYCHGEDKFYAQAWSDEGRTFDEETDEPDTSGPAWTFMVMDREHFEAREAEGRATDRSE